MRLLLTPSQAAQSPRSARLTSSGLKVVKWTAAPTSTAGLCAQWKAADATVEAARWSCSQLILSVIGAVGLGLTLWLNYRALRLAERNSAETAYALNVARQSAEAARGRRCNQLRTDAGVPRPHMGESLMPSILSGRETGLSSKWLMTSKLLSVPVNHTTRPMPCGPGVPNRRCGKLSLVMRAHPRTLPI